MTKPDGSERSYFIATEDRNYDRVGKLNIAGTWYSRAKD